MRERGLFDGEERTDFVAAGTDDTNDSRDDQENEVAGRGERDSSSSHEERAGDQHAPAADAIGARGQVERNDHVADQREA